MPTTWGPDEALDLGCDQLRHSPGCFRELEDQFVARVRAHSQERLLVFGNGFFLVNIDEVAALIWDGQRRRRLCGPRLCSALMSEAPQSSAAASHRRMSRWPTAATAAPRRNDSLRTVTWWAVGPAFRLAGAPSIAGGGLRGG